MPPLKKERRGVGTHPVTQSRDPSLKTAENPLSLSLIVFGIDSTDYPSLFHPSVLGVRPFERGVQTLSNIIAVGELRESCTVRRSRKRWSVRRNFFTIFFEIRRRRGIVDQFSVKIME